MTKKIPGKTVIEIYPKTQKPDWLTMDSKVHCAGEAQDVFTIADMNKQTCSSMLMTLDGKTHGRESWSKLSKAFIPRAPKGPRKDFRYRIDAISIYNSEDNFEDGIVGRDFQVLYEKPNKFFSTLEALFSYAANTYGVPELKEDGKCGWEQVCDDDDPKSPLSGARVETQFTVDVDNSRANKKQIERWKTGKLKLWCSTVSIYILKTEEQACPIDELTQLGILDA